MTDLSVNVDHVATLRQARKAAYPDPVEAAEIAEQQGATGITIHLRSDRRHIQDGDLERLRSTVLGKLNLEIAATDEMIELVVPIYDKYLTHDEIKIIITFYETPVGKKMIAVLPQIMQESMAAGQQWGKEIGERVVERRETRQDGDRSEDLFAYHLTRPGHILEKGGFQISQKVVSGTFEVVMLFK